MKKKWDAMLEYINEHDTAFISLTYMGIGIGAVVYLICASISVVRHGISYRR